MKDFTTKQIGYQLLILVIVLLVIVLHFAYSFNIEFTILLVSVLIGISLYSIYNTVRKKQSIDYIIPFLKQMDYNNLLEFYGFEDSTIKNNKFNKEINDFLLKISDIVRDQKKITEDVAHELKTPLTIMRGELELALREIKSKDDYQITISSTLDELIRLSKILQSLLDITRAESGSLELEFEEKDISILLDDIISDAEILAEKKSISVSSNINKSVIMQYDPVRLHQALLNIIDNAIKYSGNNAKVDVQLNEFDEYVEIKISDTGVGIPADKIDLIFDRFYRVNKKKTKKNGVGLGLSIVSWIIDKHNGEIKVSSEINKGTEFVLKLPKTQINK